MLGKFSWILIFILLLSFLSLMLSTFISYPVLCINRICCFALLWELLNDKTRMTVYGSPSQCIHIHCFLILFISKFSFTVIDTHINLLIQRKLMRMIFFCFFLKVSLISLYFFTKEQNVYQVCTSGKRMFEFQVWSILY